MSASRREPRPACASTDESDNTARGGWGGTGAGASDPAFRAARAGGKGATCSASLSMELAAGC